MLRSKLLRAGANPAGRARIIAEINPIGFVFLILAALSWDYKTS